MTTIIISLLMLIVLIPVLIFILRSCKSASKDKHTYYSEKKNKIYHLMTNDNKAGVCTCDFYKKENSISKILKKGSVSDFKYFKRLV